MNEVTEITYVTGEALLQIESAFNVKYVTSNGVFRHIQYITLIAPDDRDKGTTVAFMPANLFVETLRKYPGVPILGINMPLESIYRHTFVMPYKTRLEDFLFKSICFSSRQPSDYNKNYLSWLQTRLNKEIFARIFAYSETPNENLQEIWNTKIIQLLVNHAKTKGPTAAAMVASLDVYKAQFSRPIHILSGYEFYPPNKQPTQTKTIERIYLDFSSIGTGKPFVHYEVKCATMKSVSFRDGWEFILKAELPPYLTVGKDNIAHATMLSITDEYERRNEPLNPGVVKEIFTKVLDTWAKKEFQNSPPTADELREFVLQQLPKPRSEDAGATNGNTQDDPGTNLI